MKSVGLFTLSVCMLLSACATLSPEQCQQADWQHIGTVDGGNGYAATRLAQHQKSCQKAGIVPDVDAYQHGYQLGLEQYCQPQTIFSKAMQGLGSVSVCPNDLQAELRPFKQVPAAYLTAVDELERAEDRYDRLSSNLYFSNNISREQYLYYRQQLRFLRMDILDARTEVQMRANDVRRLKQQYQLD
ncbi:DUF2799 domain-containing protein [Vitreoscilla massiliensis]|uniref:DUF2799 domain-containing protein n=1 Tax=Vitreoscilla massiliensis TaxID=1689272 RepID=A0ABY4E6J0_9NEIS|nr:DUF2799 domain-containing protein [Vitreoscilla massiliensis]UOO90995.1 DUF2799 domain-containing protein [Vitreoscilla massiliensis]